MENHMEDFKKLLTYFRNALAFSYSWLVLCSVIATGMLAKENAVISVSFLLKLLLLCAWASFSFVFAFCTKFMKKRGFVFDLTLFFAMFVPVEILMFYWMKIFTGSGFTVFWIAFVAIVLVCYFTALLIDVLIMRKRAGEYTKKLLEYNAKKSA